MPTQIITSGESLTAVANAIRGKQDGPNIPTWQDYIAGLNNKAYVSDVKGIIQAIFPSGYTCTCTNETTTLTAPNTNGNVNFGVGFGEWTVSCNGKTITININKYKEIKHINTEVDSVLNNNSWAIISRIAQVGEGDTYWDIGDRKEIILNGIIGTLTFSNYTTYVYIIDFNHPIDKTIPDNNIIFGGFKTALTGGIDVCLCDSKQGWSSNDATKYFNMNHYGSSGGAYNTNYGGWKGCDFRYDILGATSTQPSRYGTTYKTTANVGYDAVNATITTPVANTLMAALPNDFRSILRLWDRYVDFKGNSSNIDANCNIATIDGGISLLAEFEIFGARSRANTYEQNHQKQMAYYTAGNPKIKYNHNATSTAAIWWESSAGSGNVDYFCFVYTNGNAGSNDSFHSCGLAPAFKV